MSLFPITSIHALVSAEHAGVRAELCRTNSELLFLTIGLCRSCPDFMFRLHAFQRYINGQSESLAFVASYAAVLEIAEYLDWRFMTVAEAEAALKLTAEDNVHFWSEEETHLLDLLQWLDKDLRKFDSIPHSRIPIDIRHSRYSSHTRPLCNSFYPDAFAQTEDFTKLYK